jgi:hypothetical protein
MKGKLMTTTTIFDNLVVHGYDPKKIPSWVARPTSGKPVAVAPQSESPAPVATAEQSVAPVERPVQSVEAVDSVSTAPIERLEKRGRLYRPHNRVD